jgi:hypothetical protein
VSSKPDQQCYRRLTIHKKREVLLHLSREKKIELQERIYNQHVRLLSSEPFGCLRFQKYSGLGAGIVMESLHSEPCQNANCLLLFELASMVWGAMDHSSYLIDRQHRFLLIGIVLLIMTAVFTLSGETLALNFVHSACA